MRQKNKKEIKIGNFLKDLFYRINVIPIQVLPIKDRREDILPLCIYYLNKYNKNIKYKFTLSKTSISGFMIAFNGLKAL